MAAQTLIGPEPTPSHDARTPEPAAFLLVGAGLFAGAVALRRARPGR
jgi:hypothetical protein